MPTYSQSLTVFHLADSSISQSRWLVLPIFYDAVARAPVGTYLDFTMGADSLVIAPTTNHLGGGNYWHGGNPHGIPQNFTKVGPLRTEKEKAERMFKKGNTVVITSDCFDLYADLSYFVERCKLRSRTSGISGQLVGASWTTYPAG
jgi:hypothetical protein